MFDSSFSKTVGSTDRNFSIVVEDGPSGHTRVRFDLRTRARGGSDFLHHWLNLRPCELRELAAALIAASQHVEAGADDEAAE
jgi:hypothetical protein